MHHQMAYSVAMCGVDAAIENRVVDTIRRNLEMV